MADERNNSKDRKKQNEEEIFFEIIQIIKGEKDITFLQDKGTLPAKIKNLITLGVTITQQKEQQVIEAYVINSLDSGATRQDIEDILQKAILIAELPVNKYTNIVNDAIDQYEQNM